MNGETDKSNPAPETFADAVSVQMITQNFILSNTIGQRVFLFFTLAYNRCIVDAWRAAPPGRMIATAESETLQATALRVLVLGLLALGVWWGKGAIASRWRAQW